MISACFSPFLAKRRTLLLLCKFFTIANGKSAWLGLALAYAFFLFLRAIILLLKYSLRDFITLNIIYNTLSWFPNSKGVGVHEIKCKRKIKRKVPKSIQ